jgi:hypothetical protein
MSNKTAPKIEATLGDVTVTVTGSPNDSLSDVKAVFDEEFDRAVQTYMANQHDGRRY